MSSRREVLREHNLGFTSLYPAIYAFMRVLMSKLMPAWAMGKIGYCYFL